MMNGLKVAFLNPKSKLRHYLSKNSDIESKVSEFDEEKIRELIRSPFRIVYLQEKKLNSCHQCMAK